MSEKPLERIRHTLNGGACELLQQVDLSAWTSLRIGGLADMIVRCSSVDAVSEAVRAFEAAESHWLVLGAGTNVVFSDKGLRVPVLSLSGDLTRWEIDVDGVEAGGGANLTHLARAVTKSGLDGAVELFGIPGSVGGAVRMNAGAHGVEIFDLLDWFDVVDGDGTIQKLGPKDVSHGYRSTALAGDAVVVRARLGLSSGSMGRMQERLKEVNRMRREKVPSGRSAGSVFKNPQGEAAGRLLEDAGCKGLRRGGARVSERHANVIVVSPGTKATDVIGLAREMRRRVVESCGVTLEPEVWFYDEWGRRYVP